MSASHAPFPAEGHRAYLSMGSNMGDRLSFLRQAVEQLFMDFDIDVLDLSPVYETEPVGYLQQNDFLNLCLLISTSLSPHALLDRVHRVENSLGRKRAIRFGPRTIDIDILTYDDVRMSDDTLILPHPRMDERAFVLKPLLDIVPKGDKLRPRLERLLEKAGPGGVVLYRKELGESP